MARAIPVLALFADAAVDDLSPVTDFRPRAFDSAFGLVSNAQGFLHNLRRFFAREQDARDRNSTTRDHASRAGTSPYPFLPIT
jgi:hypothetical protein